MPNLEKPEYFFDKYKDAIGDAVAFTWNGSGWKRSPAIDRTCSVSDYVQNHWLSFLGESSTFESLVYYLTNIPISQEDLREWYGSHPLIDICGSSGLGDLNTYIQLFRPGTIVPDLRARGYLAPPLNIGSALHLDGAGACLSVHTYLWGLGKQIVSTYPRLSADQMSLVLDCIGRSDSFFLPQDQAGSADKDALMCSDMSRCCYNSKQCSDMRAKGIPFHFRYELGQKETMFLAAGCLHAFKKTYPFARQEMDPKEFSSSGPFNKNSLMFSIAGNVFFFFFYFFLIFFFL